MAKSLAIDPGAAIVSGASAPVQQGASAQALPPDSLPDDAALERSLFAYKERRSRVIAVAFSSTDPLAAPVVANRAVEVYLAAEAQRRLDARARSIARLEDTLAAARN